MEKKTSKVALAPMRRKTNTQKPLKKPQYPMEPDRSAVIHAESVQTTASDDRSEPLGEGQWRKVPKQRR